MLLMQKLSLLTAVVNKIKFNEVKSMNYNFKKSLTSASVGITLSVVQLLTPASVVLVGAMAANLIVTQEAAAKDEVERQVKKAERQIKKAERIQERADKKAGKAYDKADKALDKAEAALEQQGSGVHDMYGDCNDPRVRC
jgi:vacuolar-type H+-ATPase subunit I/STV1